MGITGLYSELGPGERISLAKVASDHFEATGRRLRLAVDASIWSFQVQSGKGGTNPALRTLYYRLLRLYQLNITPLFVFDGRKRPVFKRNHKTNTQVTPTLQKNTKSYLKLFGFPYHDAPGEAEAECALLQRCGIVDAVMSEDVDTLMFGCGITFRNWSGEGKAGKSTPTHITIYNSETIKLESGLTPKGMILVALMSGGDYLPEGVPKCGIRTAVEAAKAGFGEELCSLEEDDEDGFREWRERLSTELETNKSGFFRRKNKVVKIPEDFPDMVVLGYYKYPAVSGEEALEKLRRKIVWDGRVDSTRLRESVRYAFEWKGKGGAAAFVRTLAPAILSRRLADGDGGVELGGIVRGFHGRREHSSTGGLKELRISFVPGEVVKIDLDAEEEDEVSGQDEDGDSDDEGGRKRRDYDIFAVERVWIQELYARKSLNKRIEEWETPKNLNAKVPRKAPAKAKSKPKEGATSESILKYMKVSKSNVTEKSRGKESETRICEDLAVLTLVTSQRPCDTSEPEESLPERRRSRSLTRKPVTDGPRLKEMADSSMSKPSKPTKKYTKPRREESFEGSDENHRSSRGIGSASSGIQDKDYYDPIHIHEDSILKSLYDLPCSPSFGSPRSDSPPPLAPLSRPTYEIITIESSPAPAPDVDDLCTKISPPYTPTKGYRQSGIAEAPPQSGTQTSELETPQVRTPPPDIYPNIELSPPSTPTAALGRLQVVDLFEDDDRDTGESSIESSLDFSPSAHLSPNITTRRKGRKIKAKDPQQSPEAPREKKKYVLTSPVPFPIPAARRNRPTSPLRRVFSTSDTVDTINDPIEIRHGLQVELQDTEDCTASHPPLVGILARTGAGIMNRDADIIADTDGSIGVTRPIQVEISDDELGSISVPIGSTRMAMDGRRPMVRDVPCIESFTTSMKTGNGNVVNGKTTKRIALRESLAGHWEFIEDDWSVPEGKALWKDVDVIDLTGDD